ncbi:hypothetical protein [Nocardioides caldifontis]|uniref:hypothetical protein n=1 Tax=Nocardioides caldifontis TaxID=2588938 RepID=UPI001396A69B|nr:hypothetical protein [Nocardioides caldifontis]
MPRTLLATAATTPSAGGAPTDQLLVVCGFTGLAYLVLAWVILHERRGRATLVGRAADLVASVEGGPRWFALPTVICLLGAVSGAVGVYWDVSYHITEGRDEGPLANPSHYLIFLGLLAIFFGGALGMALANDGLPRRTLRVTRTWRTPLGPAVVTGVSLCALAGFPLDDVWHRLFGQDVTEWGPTHVLMIGGTVMLPYGLLLAAAEARQVGRTLAAPLVTFVSLAYLLIGPVAFLLEFAFGVPQFPLVMDAVVLTVGTTAAFVMAAHRGALMVGAVWLFYVGFQTVLLVVNEQVWNALSPRFPLAAGGLLVGLLLARSARPTTAYGVVAGALVGGATVGLEPLWTNGFRPVEWPAELLPWAIALGVVVGAGTGVVATWLHGKLLGVEAGVEGGTVPAPRRAGSRPTSRPVPGVVALAGLLAVVAVFAWNVPPRDDVEAEVDVTVGPVEGGRAVLDVRVDEAVVEDATWFQVLSWQGGGTADGMVRNELERVAAGHYRTDGPVPVDGSWKSLVRLHTGLHTMVAAPVYLPEDPAIPAPAYEPRNGPRAFVAEHEILQRERVGDVPAWLWGAGYLSVGLVFAALLAVVAAGYTVAGRRTATAPVEARERGLEEVR